MTEHDPLCMSLLPHGPGDLCDCGTIRLVRGDEREKVALAIEEQREQFIRVTHAEPDGIIVKVYDDAARIARAGHDE